MRQVHKLVYNDPTVVTKKLRTSEHHFGLSYITTSHYHNDTNTIKLNHCSGAVLLYWFRYCLNWSSDITWMMLTSFILSLLVQYVLTFATYSSLTKHSEGHASPVRTSTYSEPKGMQLYFEEYSVLSTGKYFVHAGNRIYNKARV
jgi:hypothetical protein